MVKEDCWFGCYGVGKNGKSTLFKALYEILGGYAYSASFSLVERGRGESRRDFDIAYLQNTRFVMASETRDGTTWDEERLKRLTGGDPLHAEIKFGAEFDFLPSHKLWFQFNHQPRTRDHSIGFWRRVRLIPFTQQFSESDGTVDKNLEQALRREYDGILAWLVRACLEWQTHGLAAPQSITDATVQYQQDEDPIHGFVQKHVEKAAGEKFKLTQAFTLYQRWCAEEHVVHPLGRNRFATLLDGRYKRSNLNGSTWYRDVKLVYQCTCMQQPCTCL
jgi:putative DNA primase/helicase